MTAWLAALALAAAGDATIAWTPRRPVLGETPRIALRVRVPGAAPEAPPPRLRSSEGVLGDPRRTGPEEWSATLDLPSGGPPLLAIVSAVVAEPGGGAQVAFAAVPLSGRATVPVDTEPGARVSVDLGGERVGPFTADDRGHVEVALAVPPGGATARITAVGPGGRSVREVRVPGSQSGRIALEAVPDGPGRLRLEIFVAGGARPDEVVLETDGARLSAARPVTGRPERLTAWAEGPPREVRVRAWLRGAEPLRDEVSARLPPAQAAGPAASPRPPPARAPAPAAAPSGDVGVQAAAPLPAPLAALAVGYRARPGHAGGPETAVSLSWPLGRSGGLVLGLSGLFFAHGVRPPGRQSSLEAGLAPEGMLLAEIPGATLLAAAGPAVEMTCHFDPLLGDGCAAGLGVSARLALAWKLPVPGNGWLSAEGGFREIVAGGGRPREDGLAGGLGAALGLWLEWP